MSLILLITKIKEGADDSKKKSMANQVIKYV
jgi:hypothetical protein